jgi:hypothetical protein
MGRCAVHEVGHYFGLRHIWADDQNLSNKCTLDDYIDDTPLQGIGAGFTCNLGGNTCIELKNDMPDMFENYMDYSTEACQNIFTRQQVFMMRKSVTEYRMDLPIKTEIITKMRIFDTVVYNDILIYRWTLTFRPTGSAAVLSLSTLQKPTFVADVAGVYVATLVVNDGSLDSNVTTVAVTATP